MNNSQHFFQTIVNYTSDVLMIVDRNRHIVFVTPNLYELSGYRPEEFYNRDTFDMVHPEDREYLTERHRNLLASGKNNSSEYRVITKSGEVRYCECKTAPLPDTENYLQVVSTRDITERKLMEKELEYHKNRHEVLQNSLKKFSQDLSAVMKLADLEDRMIKELVAILPGSNPHILKAASEHERHELEACGAQLATGKMVSTADRIYIKLGERKQRPYVLSIQASAIREKMESIWLETLAHYAMMVFENLIMIENLIQQLETASQSTESPQWLLRMMFNLQEQQRLTLSSDLHDTVLQDQIDLYRRLESLIKRYELENEAKSKLIQIEQGLLDIIHDIRATCNNLRPPLLRELGLESSLENLFEHIQVTSTYKICFSSEDLSGLPLSEEQTIGIYRIVQELLQQAEQANASLVKFTINGKNDRLKIAYSDDGNAVEEDASMEEIRMAAISQRVQSLGGKLDVNPGMGSGITALLEIPIFIERSIG